MRLERGTGRRSTRLPTLLASCLRPNGREGAHQPAVAQGEQEIGPPPEPHRRTKQSRTRRSATRSGPKTQDRKFYPELLAARLGAVFGIRALLINVPLKGPVRNHPLTGHVADIMESMRLPSRPRGISPRAAYRSGLDTL